MSRSSIPLNASCWQETEWEGDCLHGYFVGFPEATFIIHLFSFLYRPIADAFWVVYNIINQYRRHEAGLQGPFGLIQLCSHIFSFGALPNSLSCPITVLPNELY